MFGASGCTPIGFISGGLTFIGGELFTSDGESIIGDVGNMGGTGGGESGVAVWSGIEVSSGTGSGGAIRVGEFIGLTVVVGESAEMVGSD